MASIEMHACDDLRRLFAVPLPYSFGTDLSYFLKHLCLTQCLQFFLTELNLNNGLRYFRYPNKLLTFVRSVWVDGQICLWAACDEYDYKWKQGSVFLLRRSQVNSVSYVLTMSEYTNIRDKAKYYTF